MLKPIDDLIECLKSSKPYGQNEALKLWEALKRLNNAVLEFSSGITNGVSSGGGGPASHIGTIDQLVIGGTCPITYDPSYYGALAVREYMTIFDQITCRQLLGLFIDKGPLNRIRILSGNVGAVALLPLSIEIGDQPTTSAFYIHTNSKVALGHINPAETLDVIGNILTSLNFKFKSGTAFIGELDHTNTANRVWVFLDKSYTIEEINHQSKHNNGGSDPLKLDDLAVPDDNTDLNSSTLRHGLLPKLDGLTTTFFRGDGVFAVPPGGGASINVGTAILNFGAFPGVSDASVAVIGQAGIVAGSIANAWMRPVDSIDHTADEHMVETLKIFAGNIIAGTGFTIYGFNTNQINEPIVRKPHPNSVFQAGNTVVQKISDPGFIEQEIGGINPRIYGQWNMNWSWS